MIVKGLLGQTQNHFWVPVATGQLVTQQQEASTLLILSTDCFTIG